MKEQVVLEIESVKKGYPGPGGAPGPEVLKGVDLSVFAGQTIAIIGPSGSGKSTLLNILGILDMPDSGHVRIHGEDVSSFDENQKARTRNGQLGFIFQDHHLLPQCTVMENILIPAMVYSSKEEMTWAAERAKTLLAAASLEHRIDYRPARLSGGERQRVAVVRALINRPGILLADEPTGSLDGRTAEEISDLILAMNKEQGTALVTVTHSPGLAERMSVVYRLEDGVLKR